LSDRDEEEAPAVTRAGRWRPTLGVLACAGALLAVGVLVFWWLFHYGVSTIWAGDGLDQHFPAVYRYNVVLRGFLAHPSAGLPTWSWNLGLGADAMGALSYYATDPFALLSLLVPLRWLEYAYEALYFLRLFVAGLASYAYLRKMKAAEFAAIAGSLMYVFVSFSLFSALRHPFFADAMVYLPLMLIGVERVLARQRPYLLVAAVFVAALSDFYFFFQLTVIVVVYAIARWHELTPRVERGRKFVAAALAVAGFYILGMALASFALLPAVEAFLASSRAGGHQAIGVFHTLGQYRSYVAALWSARNGQDSVFAGFSILGFLVVPVLLMRRGRHTALKAMLLLFAVFLVFPIFGSMMNGFAFPSYRFLFMGGLFLALGAALLLSERKAFTGREVVAMLVGLGFYTVAGLAAAGGLDPANLAPLGVGALIWGCFAAEWAIVRRRALSPAPQDRPRAPWSPVARAAVCALVVLGIALNAAASFDTDYNPRLKGYVPLGQVMQRYRDNPGSIAAALPGADFFRVDKQVTVRGSDLGMVVSNDPLVQGYHGLDYYYSIFDRNLFEFLHGVDDRSQGKSFDFEGVDDRAALDTILGVRYYLAANSATQYAPYGFVRTGVEGGTTVFRNRLALPLGFVYHAAVPASDYAAMAPLDRQQAILQGVVLETGSAPAVPRITVRREVMNVPYSVTSSGGAVLDAAAKRITANKPRGTVTLRTTPVPDAELYVSVTGIRFALSRAGGTAAKAGALGALARWAQDLGLTQRQSRASLSLSFHTTGPAKVERVESPLNPYYWGDDSTLVNLGYFARGAGTVSVHPVQAATIDYTSLKVYAVPMAAFAEQVGRLAAEGMRDVRVTDGSVSGTVTSNGDGLLFLSVPYSTGWSATVDGRPTGIVTANVAFCGIPVTDGTHRIVMRYVTPGLLPGTAFSVLGLLVLGGLVARGRRARVRSTTGPSAPTGSRVASS
jgi:uncharacterized membrane protein YfhO